MSGLLALPLLHLLCNVLGITICLGIMFSCVCRLNVSVAPTLRLSLEQLMFISFAIWACGTMAELWRGEDIGLHGAAAGLGIVIYLGLTYKHWRRHEERLIKAAECGQPHPDWKEDDRHVGTPNN